MGWYHHEIASGRDPFTDDNNSNQTGTSTSCPDGMCATRNNDTGGIGAGTSAADSASATALAPTSTFTSTPITIGATKNDVEQQYMEDGPIYHLCSKDNWMTSIRTKQPYFPPTFWLDGRFTRSCCKIDTLCDTGNEYYKHSKGEWICIVLDPNIVRQSGIPIACHFAPETNAQNEPVQCLKIYGGISVTTPNLVTKIYAMKRTLCDGTFVGMVVDESTPKIASIPSLPVSVVSNSAHNGNKKGVSEINSSTKKTKNKEQEPTRSNHKPKEETAPATTLATDSKSRKWFGRK